MKRTLTAGIMISFLVTQMGVAQKNEPPSEEQIKSWPFEMRAQYSRGPISG